MQHGFAVVVALLLIVSVNGIFDDSTIVGRAGDTPDPASPTALGLPMCQGGDISRLEGDSAYGRCADIASAVTQGMERNGLIALGVDPLSVLMLIHAESSCRTRAQMEERAMESTGDTRRNRLRNARGGLMQVDRPCLYGTEDNPDPCTTTEINVDHGTRGLRENLDRAIREEFTGRDVYWLAWLGYARGTDTSQMAMSLMRDGTSIQDASSQACAHYFGHPDGQCGVADCEGGEHCRDGKRCDYAFYCRIQDPSIGVHYTDRVWTGYQRACSIIGGEIVNGGTPSIGPITQISGSTSTGAGLDSYIAGEDVIVGDYTIDPAFRITVDYDMNDYSAVQDAIFGDIGLVNRIETCERRGDQIDSCIQSTLENLNLEHGVLTDAQITIIDGPCDPEENIKSDLVEGYADCRASEDTACVCDVELKQAPQNDQTRVEIELTRGRPAQTGIDIDSQINALTTHAVHNLGSTPVFREIDTIEINVPPQGRTIKLYKSQDTIYYVKDNQAPGIRACTMQKRTYKFCARKEGRSLWRLAEGQPVRQTPNIKFALTFPDVTPPPIVTGITVRDAAFAQNTLLVMWDKSPAPDTEEYELFFAPRIQDAFSERRDLAVLRTEVENVHAGRRTMRMQRYESALPASCEIDWTRQRCMYTLSTGQEIALEDGVLYEFDDGTNQRMTALLSVTRDTVYQVGIVAIDGHDNVMDTSTTSLPISAGASRDDLPPAPVQALLLDGTGTTVDEWIIKWDRPTRNADGSIADDVSGFKLYQETERMQNLERSEAIQTLTLAQASCIGEDMSCQTTMILPTTDFAAIAAIDGEGNIARFPVLFAPASAGEHALATAPDPEPTTVAAIPEAAIVAGRRVGVIGSSWVTDGRFLRTIAAYCTEHTFEKHGYSEQGTGPHLSHFNEDIIENRYDQVIIVTAFDDLENSGRSMESIKNNLAQMYQRGKDAGMRVIATTVLPWQGYGEEGKTAAQLEYRRRRTHELNVWIKFHPPNVDAVVDARDMLADPSRPDYMDPEYTSDGAHMNSRGNAVLGEEMFEQAFRGEDGCDE